MFITRAFTKRFMASASSGNVGIEHLASINQFRLKLKNGEYATIEYAKHNDIYELLHTDVPIAFQGSGIGAIIAEKTFEYIINQDKRIVLTCDYLKHYYQKNIDRFKQYVD